MVYVDGVGVLYIDWLFIVCEGVVMYVDMVGVGEAECDSGVVGEVVMVYCMMVCVVEEDSLEFVVDELVLCYGGIG